MSKRKVTIYELLQSQDTLDKLMNGNLPTDITFSLLDIVEKVGYQLNIYEKTLNKTLEKYNASSKLLENPNQDPVTYEKIMVDLAPLLNKTIEFDGVDITKEHLRKLNINFTVNELLKIRWLFTPIEE
jgi:hypothetical protein